MCVLVVVAAAVVVVVAVGGGGGGGSYVVMLLAYHVYRVLQQIFDTFTLSRTCISHSVVIHNIPGILLKPWSQTELSLIVWSLETHQTSMPWMTWRFPPADRPLNLPRLPKQRTPFHPQGRPRGVNKRRWMALSLCGNWRVEKVRMTSTQLLQSWSTRRWCFFARKKDVLSTCCIPGTWNYLKKMVPWKMSPNLYMKNGNISPFPSRKRHSCLQDVPGLTW